MKKYTLWILILFMSLTFLGLVTLQIRSTLQTTDMLYEQFVDGVQRSLYRSVIEIEEREVKEYLDSALCAQILLSSDLDTPDERHLAEVSMFLSKKDSVLTYTNDIFSNNAVNSSITGVSKAYSERYKHRFLRSRSLIDVVTARLINEAPQKSIEERVILSELHSTVRSQLYNVGIELPFHCAVVDKFSKIVYSCHGGDIDFSLKSYKQQFFPSIESDKKYYLYIYFQDEQNYYGTSRRMVIPFVFTMLLLLTFILAIVYIFKQRKLNEIKTDFVNNMTHELKTPVSSIYLASQMLNDPVVNKSPEFLANVSRVIRDETKRLSFQVDKVLQMSVFESEKTILSQRGTDVNAMIDTIIDNFSLKVRSKGGTIIAKLSASESMVYADEMHLGNVVYNLMDNAIKYSKDEPLILTITTWNANGRFFISIEDNGVGVKKDYQKYLFDKFYRVPTGNRHDVKGFGLGLSYVQKIVLLHKGRIKVESEFNIGTKFIIDLPLL